MNSQIIRLLKCLKRDYSENIPMPLRHETKMPMYPHKNGKWSWNDVEKCEIGESIGILLKTIVVLDFDSNIADEWESRFPILTQVPMEFTKKGRHYFFKRSIECDAFALYDKSRFMGIDGPEVDFKTVCSTGTAGLICVAPSVNKRWERSLWNYDLIQMDEDLMMYIVNNWDRKNSAKKIKSDRKKSFVFNPIPEEKIDPIKLDLVERDFSIACFKILSKTRSENYDTWIRSGWCGRNISASDLDFQNNMMDCWQEFSAKCPEKYDSDKCTQIWNNIVPRNSGNGLGLGSLTQWGQEDSETKFLEIYYKCYGYKAYKNMFEQEYVKILNPVVYVQKRDNTIQIKSRKELIDTWEHVSYKVANTKDGMESKPFIQHWLKDKTIPIFDQMDNLPPPLKCPNNCYNLWLGFALDKENDIDFDISPMIKHIDHLVDYNVESREYLLNWLAHIIQSPGKLNNIAVALIGNEGVGKNIFTTFVSHLVGVQLSGQTDNPSADIFDKFANGPQNKLIYVIDEAKGRDNYQYDNRIKNMITAQHVRMEKKGRDTISVRNTARFIFTSNDSNILNISPNDRRFVIFKANDQIHSKLYYDQIADFIENKAALAKFFKYLKNRDISNIDWISSRPMTNIYLENRLISLPMEVKYFIHLHECLPDNELEYKFTREDFIDFAQHKEEAKNYTISATRFGILISKIEFIRKHKISVGAQYFINLHKMREWLHQQKYLGWFIDT